MTQGAGLSEHVLENRLYWDGRAHELVRPAEELWRTDESVWGFWQVPETELQLLPRDRTRLSAIERRLRHGLRVWLDVAPRSPGGRAVRE